MKFENVVMKGKKEFEEQPDTGIKTSFKSFSKCLRKTEPATAYNVDRYS